jgi:hypothetical protein
MRFSLAESKIGIPMLRIRAIDRRASLAQS